MKKLTINQAAKELDFSHEYQFIEYLNEVYINGNYSQLNELFNELCKDAKKVVLLNVDAKVKDYLIINCL